MRRPLRGLTIASMVLLSLAWAGAARADVSSEPAVIRFDGGAYDTVGDLAVDADGNLYLAGAIERPSNPISFAATKLGPGGGVLWTTHYSGSVGGVGGSADAIALDAAGNVYVAGIIGDGVMFNTNWDYLVVKLGPDGAEQWARRYDGPARGFDRVVAVAVDAAGSVYVTGFSYGQNYDWATLKFTADGTLAWERRHAGPGSADDRVADMVASPSGGIVLTGSIQSTGDGLTNDVETLFYDSLGTVVWQARWTDTSTSHEVPTDLDVDGAGRIALTGTTAANPGPYAQPFPITLRYDAAGNLLQVLRDTNAGGAAVDLDPAGNAYLAGAFFATEGASTVSRYDTAGNLDWATPLSVGANDVFGVVAVGVDSTGAVTVAGRIADVSTGDGDYLTIRYAADGAEQWRYRFAGDAGGHDRATALAIADDGDAFVTGTSWNDYASIGGTADDIVTLRFAPGTAPALAAPTDLRATSPSASRVELTWQDHGGTEDGFRIERCTGSDCTAFTPVAVVGHDVTTYVESGLARLTIYRYRVSAFDEDSESAYSNTATVKTRRR
jgi:hypothetical protein